MKSAPLQPILTLPLLRQLRWSAVVGQTAAVLIVTLGLGLPLPMVPIFVCIGLTALSNAGLQLLRPGHGESSGNLTTILAFDVVLLTGLLHFTGGPHNPFSSFYLVHVALAAVALPLWGIGLVSTLCCAGFGLLYFGRQVLPIPGDAVCGVGPNLPLSTHLKGMLVAFVLTAGCIVIFVSRLQSILRLRERELLAAKERAREQEQFAALATLAAGAAHELATPLGTIAIAAGEIVQSASVLPNQPDLLADAQLVREEVARCRTILDRLQDQTGDAPTLVDVTSLISEVRKQFPNRLEIDLPATGVEICVPVFALLQALVSLVKNGFDASPPEAAVRLTVESSGDQVFFAVSDRGPGLTPEVRRHAGEPFFTTKPPGRGTGLGLFLVRLLAVRLGGTFSLEPALSGGTCARLQLPRVAFQP